MEVAGRRDSNITAYPTMELFQGSGTFELWQGSGRGVTGGGTTVA